MPIYCNEDYVKIMRPIPENWPKDIEGIPFIKKSKIDISNINNGKWLISISNVTSTAKNLNRKIVQCFKYDNELNRFYNNPYLCLERMTKCYAAATLDISMHSEMQPAQIIDATFKNRWSGAWLQMNGYEKVIVTVGWVTPDTYDICFAGIEDGTTLMISTLGVCNDEAKYDFLNGYKEMRRRFPNSQIICVGNKIEGMDDDICFVDYKHTFGNWDKKRSYWQPALFNWDFSEVNENGF